MNIKSVSGLAYRVRDIDATTSFYERLGFRLGKKEGGSASVYMNWFWVEFYSEETQDGEGGALANKSGSSQEVLMYMSVDDLPETVRDLQERGLNPTPEVVNKPRGRKETSISDPDGYRLVFFQKK